MTDWPHPDRCPSNDCRGQFFLLKHYGIVCTVKLHQLTGGSVAKAYELSREALIERSDGLGLA